VHEGGEKVLEPAKPQRAVSASTKRRPRDRSRGPLAFRYVFQGIIDTTSDLVAAHDLRGRYIAFNEAYRAEFGRIFGVELKVGDSMMDALSHLPRDQTNAFDIVQRALRGDAFTLLAEFGDERLARRLYEIRCTPLRDRRGRLIGAAYALRDVTEKHRVDEALREANATLERRVAERTAALAESEERFRAAIDHFPGTFAIYDTDRRLQFVNATGLARARRREDELLGRREEDVFRPDVVAAYLPVRERAFETGETQRVEWSRPGPSGDRTFIAIFVPLKDDRGHTRQVLGIAEEITERKRVEEALREADRRKDEFLAVLSHELRNPLAPVRNALWLLDQAVPGGAPAARAKEIINRQVAHLSRIVDDLLDVTRITRGKIHLQKARIDLLELVRRTVDDHRTLFSAREVAFTARLAHLPIWIDADPTRVSQALGNLLQNAAKFTNSGGHVEVAADRDGQGMALVEVRDDGVGIERAILGRLFEPFIQADESLHRTRGGLGLGLSLVKGLVELHGGSVEARSGGPGRGAEFVLRLPLAPEQCVLSGDLRTPSAAMPSRRVLVIEDNADAAETLREMLEMWGHEVAVAHDGRAGVEKARAFRPDVVLCDIGLPVMDGYEVARAIRADPELASTFLVAVTGYALPEDQRRAAEAGFIRHLGKPVPFEVMEEVLATAPRLGR
jgi:PAS domain S-box-containing protein